MSITGRCASITISRRQTAFSPVTLQDFANQVPVGAYPQVHLYQTNKNSFITLAENHIVSNGTEYGEIFLFAAVIASPALSSHSYYYRPQRYRFSIHLIPQRVPLVVQTILDFKCAAVPGALPASQVWVVPGAPMDSLIQNIFSYSDDIYWTKGRNAFKFGALMNQYQDIQNTIFQQGGSISSTSLSNFAKGIWSGDDDNKRGQQFPYDARFYLYTDMGFYAQDDLRATSKLTLNLGLRYEFVTVPRGIQWPGI